jgi:hypothetical protein
MRIQLAKARTCVSIIPFLALAACGGGGGVNSTPAPSSAGSGAGTDTSTTPTPTPTPTPTTAMPTPSTSNSANINYNDSEYQLSNAAVKANAIGAYSSGATGSGIKIAILDSGLTDATGQFSGRIDSASRDMVANRGISDEAGHGTSVASVVGGGRTRTDGKGIAVDTTLLIARTDSVGTCTSSSGCSHSDESLAKAVDYARTNGAKVINMSLGGSTPNSTLINAVRNATAAGIVVVISAGNDGAANPDAFALMAAQSGMNGMVIIAGSHDANYAISSFSDRAGSYGQYYLTAMGEAVRGFNQTGIDYLFSGTSYSAPAIAGAIAVLEQAFPTMTPKQIVDLLYATATDAGASGVDSVYGRGILNLQKAFQPQGGASLAGSAVPVSLEGNGQLSAVMGDAIGKTGASLTQTVIIDGYGRAFNMDIASTIRQESTSRPLVSSLVGNVRTSNIGQGPVAVSLNAFEGHDGRPAADIAKLGLSQSDAQAAHLLSGRVLARLGKTTQAVFGFDEGAGRLSAMLDGRADLPFLVARESDSTPSFAQRKGRSFALRSSLGSTGLTFAAEKGSVASVSSNLNYGQSGYQHVSVRADRQFGPVSVSFGVGMMREKETVLGSHFGVALGGGGAMTQTIDSRATWAMGEGWSLSGALRQAWTQADKRGARLSGDLMSNAFSFDITHVGRESHFGVRFAQPMRVETGRYLLNLPTGYDYDTGAVTYGQQSLSLAPKGRELTAEASYGRRLAGGWFDANLYVRREPGNIATAPTDKGAALRYSAAF